MKSKQQDGTQSAKPCDICGGASWPDVIATCSKCNVTREHIYCRPIFVHGIGDDWICKTCHDENDTILLNMNISRDPVFDASNDRTEYEITPSTSGFQKTSMTKEQASHSLAKGSTSRENSTEFVSKHDGDLKMTPDRLKELGITMEDVTNYRKHMSTIRRCVQDGWSKYKTKEEYDEYEGAAKWKRDNEVKEVKKRKRAERKNVAATVLKKRKGPMEVDGDSSSESFGTQKRQKVAAKKQGKAKFIVSESSGGDDKGWKPTESDHGSSEGNQEEEDTAGEAKRRAKFYKKLKKVHRRPNMVPEAKTDFNQSILEDYDVRLVGRSLCKMSTIRMDTFEEDFPFGVSEFLRPFRGLLELSLPYSESVVKVFYSNLKSRGGVVSSCVRGQMIEVNEKNLLQWLNVKTPQSKDTSFSGNEMDNILLEGGKTKDDSALCRPKQLPYKYRVLHYLYSRNFVNKGRHYTTLSLKDKQILTCLIRRKPFNMGKRIVDTMLKATAMGKKNTNLPYPSVVSLILEKHKIWYLQDGEPPMWSPKFDDEALHRMQIPLEAIERPQKSDCEGEKGVKGKGEKPPPHSEPCGPSHAGEGRPAELRDLFGQVLDEKLGDMKAELQSFIEYHVDRLDSRLSQMALEFKGLAEFIHLYGAEYRQFASFKATQGDHAGPSTKAVHTSVKGSAESSNHSPITYFGEEEHVSGGTSPNPTSKQDQGRQDSTHEDTGSSEHVDEENSDDKSAYSEDDSGARLSDNDEDEQEDFDGDGNESEGDTDATIEEEENSAGATGSEGETDTKEEEEQDTGGAPSRKIVDVAPVNLPGSRTSPLRRTSTRKSPAKTKKKN